MVLCECLFIFMCLMSCQFPVSGCVVCCRCVVIVSCLVLLLCLCYVPCFVYFVLCVSMFYIMWYGSGNVYCCRCCCPCVRVRVSWSCVCVVVGVHVCVKFVCRSAACSLSCVCPFAWCRVLLFVFLLCVMFSVYV